MEGLGKWLCLMVVLELHGTMDIVVRSMPGHALLGEHHGLGTAKLF